MKEYPAVQQIMEGTNKFEKHIEHFLLVFLFNVILVSHSIQPYMLFVHPATQHYKCIKRSDTTWFDIRSSGKGKILILRKCVWQQNQPWQVVCSILLYEPLICLPESAQRNLKAKTINQHRKSLPKDCGHHFEDHLLHIWKGSITQLSFLNPI